ncbi:hypothetical protein UFOVP699_69 [uncultured Caudovirales phage]|uniref:Uncharacterized protein n=1 Tax=uncultured Caudovirales phage TaxID=2100421 RepID=A0A6J5NKD9_9CAUD|nr:hypothetical protein UFOVP699_69 [uncultured Caudovirales phage]
MVKNSIYRPIYSRNEKRKNTGFDYKGQILKRSLSSQMFGLNPTLDYFLGQIEKIVYEWVEAVKQIKISANPALDKYENKIR